MGKSRRNSRDRRRDVRDPEKYEDKESKPRRLRLTAEREDDISNATRKLRIRTENENNDETSEAKHLKLKGESKSRSKVQFAEGPPDVLLIPSRVHVVEGLDCFNELDHLFVHEHINQEPLFDAWATSQRYDILTAYGRRIFYAAEYTAPCNMICCTAHRPFEINLLDSSGSAVITMIRVCKCTLTCCPCCCGNEVFVTQAKTGERLGSVLQECGGCRPTLHVLDPTGNIVLIGKGDACGVCSRCCHTMIFTLYLPDGMTEVGKISKQEPCIDEDNRDPTQQQEPESFGTSFPIELDSGIKAVLLAASFMVDFAYFGKGS